MNNTYLEIDNVTKKYGSKIALDNISVKINKGHIVGLLGPNGSGKTTLIKTIMAIIKQQAGTIKILGNDVCYDTRKYLSFMPDREFLYDTMNVEDAIKYYRDLFIDFDTNKANELCQKLDITKDLKIKELSKGNREKVSLILTLARQVPIYLLDEPLGSLDPLVKTQMLQIIKEEANENKLFIISTHLVKDTEEILDEIIFLKDGQIIFNDSVDSIKANNQTIEQKYLEVFLNA